MTVRNFIESSVVQLMLSARESSIGGYYATAKSG
jgi:hypothetical protein